MRDKVFLIIAAAALLALVAEFAKGQTQIGPQQMKAPKVAVLTCVKPPTATADCSGLYYVDVVTAAGTELKIVGTVQPNAVNAADWSLVP